jgi:hypothetical protein
MSSHIMKVSVRGADLRDTLNGSDPVLDKLVGRAEMQVQFNVEGDMPDALEASAAVIRGAFMDRKHIRISIGTNYAMMSAMEHDEAKRNEYRYGADYKVTYDSDAAIATEDDYAIASTVLSTYDSNGKKRG